jgi:hypothetical protein
MKPVYVTGGSDIGSKPLTCFHVGLVGVHVDVVVLLLDPDPLDALLAGRPQPLDLLVDRSLDPRCKLRRNRNGFGGKSLAAGQGGEGSRSLAKLGSLPPSIPSFVYFESAPVQEPARLLRRALAPYAVLFRAGETRLLDYTALKGRESPIRATNRLS